MTLVGEVAALATRVATEIKAVRRVPGGVRALAHASTITVDASTVGNVINIPAAGAEAIAEPTNGVDGQVLRLRIYCATAQTITFQPAIRLSTGLTTRVFPVSAGQVLIAGLEFVNALPSNKWVLIAATTSAT